MTTALLEAPTQANPGNRLRAFLYGRVSSHAQEEHGYSLPEQREVTAREAERLNADVVGESFEQG